MKILAILPFVMILALSPKAAWAKLNVVTAYPWIADLARSVGGDRVSVETLASGDWDPHHVVPRPSLIVKVRRADLLFINGAQLEIGWLPALIRQANNPKVIPGAAGYIDLSQRVELMDKPVGDVSRAMGDVHPDGNPHYALDPANVPILAGAVADVLCREDAEGCGAYRDRLAGFTRRWTEHGLRWEARMKPLAGAMVVEYHRVFDYFFRRYGIAVAGTIEPIPGMPPSARHTEELIGVIGRGKVNIIAQDVYHSRDAADYLAEKTGARVVVLPHDAGAVEGADDLLGMFEALVSRMAP